MHPICRASRPQTWPMTQSGQRVEACLGRLQVAEQPSEPLPERVLRVAQLPGLSACNSVIFVGRNHYKYRDTTPILLLSPLMSVPAPVPSSFKRSNVPLTSRPVRPLSNVDHNAVQSNETSDIMHTAKSADQSLSPIERPQAPPFSRRESHTRPRRISDCNSVPHTSRSSLLVEYSSSYDDVKPDLTTSRCAFIGEIPYFSCCSCESDLRPLSTSMQSHEGLSTEIMSLTTLYGGGSFADFLSGISLPR